MSYNYCLACGASLKPNVNECPICGYNDNLVHYHDVLIDDEVLNDLNDAFIPEDDADNFDFEL